MPSNPESRAAAVESRTRKPQSRLRADLHVHSYHSGYASHLRFLKTRDCYSDPEAIYRAAKARGMDLVCLTDHDSIDGCLEYLNRRPDATDFIVGEEIECTFPARTRGERTSPAIRIHIGALGMTERIHRELQPLRGNVFELVEYLRQEDVFFALNHLFFFFHHQIPTADYVDALLAVFPAFEVRNGAMCREHNELIGQIAADPAHERHGSYVAAQEAQSVSRVPVASSRFSLIGGSDAHTLTHVGRTWTEAPATTREEFLAALKAGATQVGGAHGSVDRMAGEIYSVIRSYWAGLIGLERHDLTRRERALGAAFSLASLPFQFIPAVVALTQKSREHATIERVRTEWNAARLDRLLPTVREAQVTT